MVTDKYVQELKGLDTGSTRRLDAYVKSLRTDRFKIHFDKKVASVILDYAKNPRYVRQVLNHCRNQGFGQSIYEYSKMEEQIERFAGQNHSYFGWNRWYKQAKSELCNEVRAWNLRMHHPKYLEDVLELIPRQDTHAGWTYITTGNKLKGENLEGIFEEWSSATELARKQGQYFYPILIGRRTQAKMPFDADNNYQPIPFDYKTMSKSRVVSMIDMRVIISESMFAKPFQHALGQTGWYAGGKDDGRINSRVQELRWRYDHWLTLDYSKFDQSISDWLINDAFDVVREAFRYDTTFDEELYSVIKRTFISKAFIDGHGNLVTSCKGVPSGSMFTQIIDSVVNRLMVDTYMKSRNISSYAMIIMGDDNIIYTGKPIDAEDMSSYLTHNFGIVTNPSKCARGTQDDLPEFLSRFWTLQGAWRDPSVLISKMCYPEHFRDYKNKDGLDPVMIVYSYILSFPVGMSELIDIEKFELDYASSIKTFSKEDAKHGSGSLRFRIRFGLI